jgi:predicted small metal-binding protein
MKALKCSDLGERTCNFIAEASSIEEAERKLLDHAESRHPMFLEAMTFEEKERILEHVEAMAMAR